MRHRKGGFKLGRNTSHRRALLRNLVTSIILNDRVHTTVTKAKATRPIVEKMITLGKNGSVHARRQALAYLMGPESVDRLFNTVAPRYAPQGRCFGDGVHRVARCRAGAQREGSQARREPRQASRRVAEAARRAWAWRRFRSKRNRVSKFHFGGNKRRTCYGCAFLLLLFLSFPEGYFLSRPYFEPTSYSSQSLLPVACSNPCTKLPDLSRYAWLRTALHRPG